MASAPCPWIGHSGDALTPRCGGAEVAARAYTIPARWPFSPIHLVMETQSGSCDLYSRKARFFCCGISSDGSRDPEPHIREAISSFLHDCARRPCHALDLGANNGWFTMYMLQLGARVVAVEPAVDLAWAIGQSAELNCARERATIVNARACTPKDAACSTPRNTSTDCNGGGWRWGNVYGPSQLASEHGPNCWRLLGLTPKLVDGVQLEALLERSAGRHGTLDLVKMDADGPEGGWLLEIDRILSDRPVEAELDVWGWWEQPLRPAAATRAHDRRLLVRAILLEGNKLDPRVLWRFQMVHGYTVLRLDAHDGRRLITPEGWDAYSPAGTMARLDRLAAAHYGHERAFTTNSLNKRTVEQARATLSKRKAKQPRLTCLQTLSLSFLCRPGLL